MSDTKFTQGEWFPCFGSYEVAVLNGKGFIETLITDTGPQSIPNDDEAMANQHLIAAAPDMYNAMYEFIGSACDDDIESAREIFIGILKKARGE
tara:strand:+ start:55 stop:336 length:282 start_codon:yes stop_codon:yes gene_type:complete